MAKIENVDQYLDSISVWSDEIHRLVKILRGCSMDESIKWGVPVYSLKSKNIVGVSGFKSYFGLWFYQGALIDDPHQVLINAQEGKTRGMRQWRMTSSKEIRVTWIKTLIKSSKAIVEQGKEIKPRRNKPLDMPELLELVSKPGKLLFDGIG